MITCRWLIIMVLLFGVGCNSHSPMESPVYWDRSPPNGRIAALYILHADFVDCGYGEDE